MNIITIIGTVSAILTTLAFLPQAIKTIKTKHTRDLSLLLLIIQSTGNFGWIIYGYLIMDLPILFANIFTFSLVFIILILKIKYK